MASRQAQRDKQMRNPGGKSAYAQKIKARGSRSYQLPPVAEAIPIQQPREPGISDWSQPIPARRSYLFDYW